VSADTSRHDAGRGLWLAGDGVGGFRAVPARESGITVYGEGRGAALADYDQDGRIDLAVAQHGGATRLFRNQSGQPGLRVRLEGSPINPQAVGAQMRVTYADGTRGPAREIHAGAGYWSQDSATAVLGLAGQPQSLTVRWPGGKEVEVAVPAGATSVTATLSP